MLSLFHLLAARVIVTIRDPRDSIASQHVRFGFSFRSALEQVSKFFATVATLDRSSAVLVLRYEDGFAANPDTLVRLQAHLGVALPPATLEALFAANTPERVRERIDRWVVQARLTDPATEGGAHWSEATHWHPGHVGDGLIGKWTRVLTPEQAEAVTLAVPTDLVGDGWMLAPLRWLPLLFDDADGHSLTNGASLRCPGTERVLAVGPRLFLPAGRWRVTALAQPAESGETVRLKIEVHVDRPGRGIQALRVVTVPRPLEQDYDVDLEHVDHADPIEIRLSSVQDGRQSRVIFTGVDVAWLGPIDALPLLLARPIR